MVYSLQAYRGLSSLLVVLVHAASIISTYFDNQAFVTYFHFCRGSVPYFFVLSGFIIYYIHEKDMGRKDRVSDYVAKRCIRIYPIYWIVTLALLPLWLLNPDFGESYHREFSSLLMSLLLLPQNNPPHIEVGWTLIHEFLFYVLFTFLVFNKKWGASIIIGWSISIVLAQLFFRDLVFPYSFFLAEINLLFGLGMLAAFLNQRLMKYRIHSYLFLIGSLFFIITGIAQNKLYLTHDLALYFGFASFLITLGCNYQPIENFFRKRKFLNFIGNASYSIYLTHFFILAFLGIILSRLAIMESIHYIFIYLAIVPIALTGGLICYTLIEKPLLLYMRGKWRQWQAKSVTVAPRTAQAAESGR